MTIQQHRQGSLQLLVANLVATREGQELLPQYYEDIPTLTDMYTQEHKTFGQLIDGIRIPG